MSSIYIEVGQCGCQIGHKINKRLQESYYSTRMQSPRKVRAIMIDTESKVLKPFIDNPPLWLDPDNVRFFEYGRGNNWSYGYMHDLGALEKQPVSEFVEAGHRQFSHRPANQEEGSEKRLTEFEEKVLVGKYIKENKEICAYTLERLRRELESADCAMAVNIFCSLGGGTGSGLGTKIVEKVSEEFCIDLFAHVVLPNKSGETPLQVYNCVLSLCALQEHATAILPIENEKMLAAFLLGQSSPKARTDLDLINSEIAAMHSRLFRLNDNPSFPLFYNSLISECVISPQHKYVTLFGCGSPQGLGFDGCFQQLCQQLRIYNEELFVTEGVEMRREKCLAHNMIVLNPEKSSGGLFQEQHWKKLRNIINPVEFNSLLKSEEIELPPSKKKEGPEIAMLMNHSNILRYLQYLQLSGRTKYEARAYLWHYSYADLPGAFESLEAVIDQYHFSAHS